MAQFRVCECCGAHLDFGERCDCGGEGGPAEEDRADNIRPYGEGGPAKEDRADDIRPYGETGQAKIRKEE